MINRTRRVEFIIVVPTSNAQWLDADVSRTLTFFILTAELWVEFRQSDVFEKNELYLTYRFWLEHAS